jgi:hypothetical protein
MSVKSFLLYTALAVIILLAGLLSLIPPTGIQAQAVSPPLSIHLPLIFNQTDSSVPTLLAADQSHPDGLVVDSGNVYWTNCGTSLGNSTDGAIMVYSISQAASVSLLSGRSCPEHLYVEPDALFWLEHTWIDGTGEFSVFRWPMSGGQPEKLVTYQAVNGSLSLDDTHVYWMEAGGTVMRRPRAGEGTPQTAPVPALVFDGPDAYWLNGNGDLIRSGKDGSSPVTLVRQSDLDGLAGRQPSRVFIMTIFPRSFYLYFTVFIDNYPGFGSCTDQRTALMRMPRDGGAYSQVAWAAGRVEYFVTEPFAYAFGGYCMLGLQKVYLDSQSVETIVVNEAPSALAEDAAFIYWVDYDNGWVKRILK